MKKFIFYLMPLLLCGCETLENADPAFFKSIAEKAAELLSKF